MIQIDDSGSGSFIGGTCIGVYRAESNEYYFDIIPVELYNKENFKKKLYLDEVVNIIIKAFDTLRVTKNETIEVCRGYMFEKLKTWLDDNEYCWYSTHITGRIQEIVEKNFELYTIRLGLPAQYIKYTRFPFHFHKLLKWVFADFDNRIGLCKVGWKSWSRIEGTVPTVTEEYIYSNNFICLKCGRHIKKGSKVKILHYFSNQDTTVFLHTWCFQDKKNMTLPISQEVPLTSVQTNRT